jgi:hypothetical protein
MVGSKCILEFLKRDNMVGWEHGKILLRLLHLRLL